MAKSTTTTTATRKPRTRRNTKPQREACVVCAKPAELGTICDACVDKESSALKIYVNALHDPKSRALLKTLTKAQRSRILPSSLTDYDAKQFVEKGIITGGHQSTVTFIGRSNTKESHMPVKKTTTRNARQQAKAVRDADFEAARAAERKITPRTRTSAKRSSKVEVKATPVATVKPSTGITAAQVARDAGIDGRKFRMFLRANGLKVTDTKSAKSAVTKFNRQS